jgi:hypothetical protein
MSRRRVRRHATGCDTAAQLIELPRAIDLLYAMSAVALQATSRALFGRHPPGVA